MTLKKLDLKFSAGNPMLQFTQRTVISPLIYLQKQVSLFCLVFHNHFSNSMLSTLSKFSTVTFVTHFIIIVP